MRLRAISLLRHPHDFVLPLRKLEPQTTEMVPHSQRHFQRGARLNLVIRKPQHN
jgi:hypothetical protein